MQNKPNLPDALMNVTSFYTVDYENKPIGNLAKTNPIQSQYKAKTNPIPERPEMNENLFATKVYENITTFALRQNKANTNPIKPNFHPKNQHILSDVKSEINNIAILNNVILAFKPNSASGLEGLLTAKLF